MVFALWGARSSGGGGLGARVGHVARGTAGTAATLLGLRVSRAATLRVSALLALRSLLAPLELPLSSDVAAGLWAAAFAAAQTAAFAAAAADRLRLPGALGRWGAALLSPVDAPFVSLYAAVVLVLGPLCALAESVIVVYEVVRVVRRLEDRADSPDPAEVTRWRGVTLALTVGVAAAAAVGVAALGVPEVAPAVGVAAAALLAVTLYADAGNILHAALLAAYVAYLGVAALAEELDVSPGFGGGPRDALHGPEARAALLVVSSLLALVGLMRGPAFVSVAMYSAEAVQADLALAAPPMGAPKGAVNALAVVALTFRFLVFHRDVLPGEYYPLVCRAVQVLLVVGLYALIMRLEGRGDGGEVPGPVPSAANGYQ